MIRNKPNQADRLDQKVTVVGCTNRPRITLTQRTNLNNSENSRILTLTLNEYWERDNLLMVLALEVDTKRAGVKPDTPEGRIG